MVSFACQMRSYIICLLCLLGSSYGLKFTMSRDTFEIENRLYCGQLTCTADTGPHDSALVNLSISVVSQLEGKTLMTMLSETDTEPVNLRRRRGAVVGGKTQDRTELLMSLADPSVCFYETFVCEFYFINAEGQVNKTEKIILPLETDIPQDNIVLKTKKSPKWIPISRKTKRSKRSPDIGSNFKNASLSTLVKEIETNSSFSGSNNSTMTQGSMATTGLDVFNETYTDQDELPTRLLETFQGTFKNTTEELQRRLNSMEDKMSSLAHNFEDFRQLSLLFSTVKKQTNKTTLPEESRFTYKKYISEPHVIKCERNMDLSLPSRLLVTVGNKVVMCDTKTDRGGWIIMQRRVLGDISFTRNWTDYKLGFGSYIGDFWLGNEFVHQMTSEGMHQLRIDLIYRGSSYHAVYNSFRIEDEASFYTLRLGQHYGNAKDQLNYNKDMRFATYDRADNNNCAIRHAGGWWFDNCHYVFLNGIWMSSSNSGVIWSDISGYSNSLCSVEMKFRKQL